MINRGEKAQSERLKESLVYGEIQKPQTVNEDGPIRQISDLDIEEFRAELERSAKRTNNILVPMRSVFTMAFKDGIIRDNVMARVDNLRIEEPTINPLSQAG